VVVRRGLERRLRHAFCRTHTSNKQKITHAFSDVTSERSPKKTQILQFYKEYNRVKECCHQLPEPETTDKNVCQKRSDLRLGNTLNG
jgi:hypothetical protein